MESIFSFLEWLDTIFWGHVAFIVILLVGLFFTIKGRAFQVRVFLKSFKNLTTLFTSNKNKAGVSPLFTFFASVGGMIGVGNLVGIVTAVQIGGPGALFWVWIAGFIGSVIKYSEVSLGLQFRVKNEKGSFDGGPMYFLRRAFKNSWVSIAVAVLLCIYGVEIYQFRIITNLIATNTGLTLYSIIPVLLVLIFYPALGGVRRLGRFCTIMMPLFIFSYLVMGFWVIFHKMDILPEVLSQVFKSAFTGHAAIGGFAGSSALLAIQHGMARTFYSGDIGIGFDSIIQSESSVVVPEHQGSLAVIGVWVDNLSCTITLLIILLSGIWTQGVDPLLAVQLSLSHYFPLMNIFVPSFLLIAGYTTLISYLCVGMKCARYLSPNYGMGIYIAYAAIVLPLFSFLDSSKALLIMSISGCFLLLLNLTGIFKLRGYIQFPKDLEPEKEINFSRELTPRGGSGLP